MGRPKQLLRYRGKTLLRHAVDAAMGSRCRPVIVVVGAQSRLMRDELIGLPVGIVENSDWDRGMGASIRAGLGALIADRTPPAVTITLCDQPAVTLELINQLIDRHDIDKPPIVASFYNGILGVPALFDRQLFDELLHLNDSSGARELIRRHAHVTARIDFAQGAIDVDTPDDFDRLT
jgi:molybdenum cofactor cytidylyltransferase